MKLAVVTRSDENIKEMTSLTHPVIKSFAKKWDADFIILEHDAPCHRHYRIMEFRNLFGLYDRILSIDSDVIISTTCPNPFLLVPVPMIGSVFEDVGTREQKRRKVIKNIQERFGDIGWKSGYINTGFAMFSKEHKDIFQSIDGHYWDGFGFDDAHLAYNINKRHIPIYQLPYQYNHMTMFSEAWNRSADRFESFVIHYAGIGKFENRFKNRIENMRYDMEELWDQKHTRL